MKKFVSNKLLNVLIVCTIVFTNFFTLFGNPVSAESGQADGLFISEYVEGSSYNKAVEIYNGTGQAVDLSQYTLELYSNGNETPNQTLNLSGSLSAGDVYVVAHSSASAEILNVADETAGVVNFNGNDAFTLTKNDTPIDILGTVGQDGDYAKDVTLVRTASITSGNTTYTETEWNSHAKDTIEYLGSHSMDGDPSDPGDPGDPVDPGEPVSIEEARSLAVGTEVTVEGVVTADNSAIGGGQLSTYIQDETAGINVFNFDATGYPVLEKGDRVQVTGTIDEYQGLLEVVPNNSDSVEVLSENQPLPAPQEITLADMQDSSIAEPLEGSRVQVNGYISSIPESPAGGGYNISLIDEEFNGTTLRVMEDALDVSQLEEGTWYDITAILSQYHSYQLIPTEAADITVADEQPEPPSAAGEYTSTVEYVTDGDTIRLETPVLGSDRVRFVNIDTPETDMGSANGAHGENQDEHGEAAKTYLQSLLQPGDEVTLKIGDEPTDNYGRLLAQVINKDGINTNLEMVREGYAATYFLWPFGENAQYDTYQSAVKAAKDAGKGIWNPDNPLIELPFEYRAILEGGDFDKFVGHSDTKEYVQPTEFEQVPVHKRIFFWSESDAIEAGYTAAGDSGGDPVNPGETVSVQLLGLNDLHGKIDQEYELDLDGDGQMDGMFGRMDYVAGFFEEREQENPNTLKVHAGDMIGASSPVSALYQDEPTVEIMEEMGFDVGTVGNHEFDEGTEELMRMVNGGDHPEGTENYDGMNFDVLCANCVGKNTGETILPPYAVKEVAGQQIGFIGVTTQETPEMVMPDGIQNMDFTDEKEAIDQAVDELTSQGIESIVVLSHVPGSQSGDTSATGAVADLARSIDDEVDMIFAAHNHQVVNGVVDDKLIVQAYEYGKAFADIDLEIDTETGDIVDKQAEIVYTDQSKLEPDTEVASILDKYSTLIEEKMNEVLGYNAYDLTGDYSNDGDHGLGNFLADGMKWAMDSDFAMMNGGGIRDDLLAGEVTWGDLFNIQPFGNVLMKFDIKGKDLYPILNAQLSSQYGPDYSISGFHYTWNPETTEVVDITLPDGTPIDENKTYTLTVNNYMGTSQGEKYRPIGELGQNPVMGPEDIEATVDFINHLNTTAENPLNYHPDGEGRITEGSAIDYQNATMTEARDAAVGSGVILEGIVTYVDGMNYYVQDETGGIVVRSANLEAEAGDKIQAKGVTSEYYGLLQVVTEDAEVTETNAGEPEAVTVQAADVGEAVEGQLVELEYVTTQSANEFNEYQAEDVSGEVVLADEENLLAEGQNYKSLIGVVTYSFGGYKVIPRKPEDVTKLFFVHEDGAVEDAAETLVESSNLLGLDRVKELLKEQLTEVVETKGNTKQHIKSVVHHVSKSLSKIEQGKGNRTVELRKIDRELNKLF
ncbi:endonuclease [Virgibacillus sp. MSP4-1]|uniref:5'-nucleotidase C-terminal domain-containing protein n=1 Tax=Virgibacillus sp. MSP4-1 TaxID=2700081 RepID=UPI0003A5B580|nr:5'-nucleotidase C-terminal domain-containing protein [Virgibacillus sp. MSP4-1]QHS24297.1 endonuclease [Virgibacillus sp. MSP4-1]